MSDIEAGLKRYAVFGSRNYYPSGGFGDFLKSFDDLTEASQFADQQIEDDEIDWAEINDLTSGETVATFSAT